MDIDREFLLLEMLRSGMDKGGKKGIVDIDREL